MAINILSESGELDTFEIPYVERVYVMSSAQVGKTELVLNVIGYHVDYDPSPILQIQPTLEMGEAFSKDRLAPMVRDTPALNGKIADPKSKTSGNTLLHKSFPGGHITIAGANSPAGLASRPIRLLLADEVDRYPISAGTEGDPFALGVKRTNNFWNRKIVGVSTPTVKDASRIESLYADSTQERWCLPCPECGAYQPLTWGRIDFDTASHACDKCGALSDERAWKRGAGLWIAQQHHAKNRGFHLSELVSPWRKWAEIIAEFLVAKKSPETLKTFVNTSLGETWEESGEGVEGDSLLIRRETYPADVPADALVVVAGVDVQDDRLEVRSWGFGENEQSWLIERRVIRGDPAQPAIWAELDEFLLERKYQHEAGQSLHIAAAAIDSGGHHTQKVYDFCRPRSARRVYAIKGKGGAGLPIVSAPSKKKAGKSKRNVDLFTVGVDGVKGLIYSRLKIETVGPGFIHLPEWIDQEELDQLTAEKLFTRFVRGFAVREWRKVRRRNEALDCYVYAIAALRILNPIFSMLRKRLHTAPETIGEEVDEPSPLAPAPTKTKQLAKRPRRTGGGFVNGWKK